VSTKWHKWGSPIALLVVLAALVYAGWWGYKALTNPVSGKQPACVNQTVGEALTSAQVTVRVYNGGTSPGLAKTVSASLSDKGFKIGYTGNTDEKVTATTIIGTTSTDPEVKLVAGFFPGATVQGDNRTDHSVDVLLTTGPNPFTLGAPTQIGAPGGVVCLPEPSPTPVKIEKTPPPAEQTPS